MLTKAVGHHNNSKAAHAAARLVKQALHALPPNIRGHVVAVIGEFVGTLLFLFFAFAGTQVANVSSNPNTGTTVITTTAQKTPQQLLYISLAFGFSLAVNAWTFFRISGGLFNPAVTVGMYLIGAITIIRAILLFVTQIVAAIAAAAIVSALFTGGLNVSTELSATTTIAQGVIIEMLLTMSLVFTIFMLAAEKHTGNFIAPVGIGLALFIAEMTGVFWTGGSLNPARSFAPAVVTKSFASTQWIYWVGPMAGSVLAVLEFKLIKALEYTTVNGEETAEEKQANKDLEAQTYKEAQDMGAPLGNETTSSQATTDTRTNGTAGPGLASVQNTKAALPNDHEKKVEERKAGY
ncbi:related to aquaporin [Rhynchosporium agropyri]|uniref:Related to aquaporin n=1 Tax=Rhynchosporium agropyri TaxID=914238 RepID=A0A1E1JS36_9HELO|nr:related to aquaporin [Rhynchosporium agropyri]